MNDNLTPEIVWLEPDGIYEISYEYPKCNKIKVDEFEQQFRNYNFKFTTENNINNLKKQILLLELLMTMVRNIQITNHGVRYNADEAIKYMENKIKILEQNH